MQFKVLSRTNAKKLSYKKLENSCIIISITDVGSYPVSFAKNEKIRSVLKLSFDDVDAAGPYPMTTADAQKVLAFVACWKNHIKEIIVHCEAGVSRSAGVCAALMLWLNGDDKPIFDNPYFHPNMHCYRTVLNNISEL